MSAAALPPLNLSLCKYQMRKFLLYIVSMTFFAQCNGAIQYVKHSLVKTEQYAVDSSECAEKNVENIKDTAGDYIHPQSNYPCLILPVYFQPGIASFYPAVYFASPFMPPEK